MTEKRAGQLITESFENLKTAEMVDSDAVLTDDTILLGVGSPLDSIGFVTFITDLEEKLIEETDKDLFLVLNEINDFNVDKPHLTTDVLRKYIVKLSEG